MSIGRTPSPRVTCIARTLALAICAYDLAGCRAESDSGARPLAPFEPSIDAGSVRGLDAGSSKSSRLAPKTADGGAQPPLMTCASGEAKCRDASSTGMSAELDDAGPTSSVPGAMVERIWSPARPQPLGMLVGHEARYANPDVAVAGSDMA